jgi:predicted Zn-dependent peptidase
MKSFRMQIVVAVAFYSMACAQQPTDTKPERMQLENGVTLLLAPLPEAKIVAVETFYAVGFCDEPAGMTQAAHLLEHLICQGATKSYGPGESFAMLRKLGMANAETLPTFTHYDYTAQPEELKTILKIEGERLTSLKITPELISDEADKCHEEAQYVYKDPKSGMLKHAFMALFQFWNHGATEVRVRSGLDQIPADKLESFYRAQYRPDQLTVAIVGNFEKDEALAIAKEHLGAIPSRKVEQKSLNWDTLPAKAHITWDADVHAISVYAPPPTDPKDRALLSLWGTALMERLSTNAALKEIAHMNFSSNTTWPVGDLPLFVYATAKSADKIPQIESLLKDQFRSADKELDTDVVQMPTLANMVGSVPVPPWKDLQAQAATFAKTTGRSEDDAMPMILGNVALQWGLRELNGATPANEEITVERLKALLEKTLDAGKLKVVTLGPPPETGLQEAAPKP